MSEVDSSAGSEIVGHCMPAAMAPALELVVDSSLYLAVRWIGAKVVVGSPLCFAARLVDAKVVVEVAAADAAAAACLVEARLVVGVAAVRSLHCRGVEGR